MPPVLCDDSELGYLAGRTEFVEGRPLCLDDSYRLAHLPLVAPRHPGVIARRDGKPYDRGRHPPVASLVLPVPAEPLHRSLTSTGLDGELRRSPLAAKIAWHILPRRRDRLHATLCGSLAGGATPAAIGAAQRMALAQVGPVTVELRGLFSGTVNLGRLYLRAYPEKRQGLNAFQRIQDIMGYRRTGLYLVGLYNLIDDLDAAETTLLAALIERWWDKPLLRFQADALWLLGASDDLVLDGSVIETVALR